MRAVRVVAIVPNRKDREFTDFVCFADEPDLFLDIPGEFDSSFDDPNDHSITQSLNHYGLPRLSFRSEQTQFQRISIDPHFEFCFSVA